ncbi:MAG: Do family serine endopeptidase [Candidatus Neomarinimicrobiota bacterium]
MQRRLLIITFLLIGILSAQNSIVKQFSSVFADVAEKANPAVVTITAEKVVKMEDQFGDFPFFHRQLPDQEFSSEALGSGVIVDAKKGYILTNNHVVENAEKIQIKLIDKRIIPAIILGSDPKSDLAILQIEAESITQIPLGDSDELRVGEWVLAVGSPFSANLSHSVTAGIVSALGRSYVMPGNDHYENFIQTDAAINPGNSGGALLNLDGELIGINTAIITGGYERSNRGVGFAIPSNMIKKVMNDLIEKGYVVRSWLGVYIQPVEDKVARALNLLNRDGALVSDVVEDSPAGKAGLVTGDVIVEFDGKKVLDPSHLKNIVSSSAPGKVSKVGIVRDGKRKTINITLEELEQDSQTFATSTKSNMSLGIEVRNISDSLAERYEIDPESIGVLVTNIDKKSNAYDAGIRVGDVITRVGTKKVNSKNNFEDLVEDLKDQDSLLLLVKRGDRSSYFAFEID